MRASLYLLLTALLALAIATITPHEIIDGRLLPTQIAFAVFLFLLQVITAWLFLSSLATFSGRLKVAYTFLAIGMVCFGVAELQFPVLGMIHSLDGSWVKTGMGIVPFILSGVAIYIGARQFAVILSVRSRAMSWWWVLGITFFACLVITRVPHLRITGTSSAEFQYEAFMSLLTLLLCFNVAAALILWRIRVKIGTLYEGAVTWLAAGMTVGAIAEGTELLYSLLSPYSLTFYTKYSLNYLPVIAAVVVLLFAGTAFRRIARLRLHSDATYIDVVTYMEQLVSDPSVLTDVRDKLLYLTVRLPAGKADRLSQPDIQTLTELYLRVEDYLVTKEPLRTFTREELRARLPERIAALLKTA